MSRTRIKICGVRESATALVAARAGAWAIGLVFVESSPRYVDVETARQIARSLPAGVEPVGLFKDQPRDTIRAAAERVGLKLVQLHGKESPEQASALSPLRVIKAVKPDDLARWRGIGNLGAILFDSEQGGSGKRFDWTSLTKLDFRGLPPMILAGGLTPGNVEEAIGLLRPWAVDVSSGVESARGVKDPAKIVAFCEAVQRADQRGVGTT